MVNPVVNIPATVNPDLVKERKQCTFDPEEFAKWWVGGEKKLQERRKRVQFFFDDPIYKNATPNSFLSHKEVYEKSVRQASNVLKKVRQLQSYGDAGTEESFLSYVEGILESGLVENGSPFVTHFVMFCPALVDHGTPEQQAHWVRRACSGEILGTYVQTELAHGTYVRGLETTATYDPKTEEFILNSPTLTSYKWWPGGLGHTVNHCVLLAQLYTQGKNCGVQPFIVQLREDGTHKPMKGIHIGEIGNKIGMNGVNNGFLGFKNVRIPRNQMLMRNAQVSKDGTFVKSTPSYLTYGTITYVRVYIVKEMAHYLSKSATIAIRYSAVRRQSPIHADLPEPQILDHVTQQHKLFPVLAKSILFKLAADNLMEKYIQFTSDLESGNLDRLPELHALSCCLKAASTNEGTQGVEICRLACGGHGYLSSSSFTTMYGMVTAAITYDGENTILFLQTARFLMKAWKSAINGNSLTNTVAYLNHHQGYNQLTQWNPSILGIIDGLKTVAGHKIKLAYEHIEKRKASGQLHEDAVNSTSIELVAAAEAYCRVFIVESGYEMMNKSKSTFSLALGEVLTQIFELYVVDLCLKSVGDLIRFTQITESDIQSLQSRLEAVLAKLRPNAVGIVDGFDFDDRVLNSTLGAYDGNVYERLFIEALKSPLNQEPVNKSFDLYLKPMMNSKL